MQLNRALAKQIVEKAKVILKHDLALTDLSGQLLASSQPMKRPFVPEALSVAQTGHSATGDFEGAATRWWPFIYDGSPVAIFGLSHGPDTPVGAEATTLLDGLAEVIVYQHFLLDRIQSTERVRADFINQVLNNPTIDVTSVYRQADILQLPLRVPQAAILFHLEGLEIANSKKYENLSSEEQQLRLDQQTEEIAEKVRTGFKNHSGNLVAYLGGDRFVVLKGIGGDGLTTLNTIRFMTEKGDYTRELLQNLQLPYSITIGIGQYYPDLRGLRKSYQDAKLALEVGLKVWGQGQCYHIKRVGMFITLASTSPDRKAELAHQILSPLLKDDQLYKTVQSFLTSGLNLTDAAETLHIHRNTLIYRLDKTKKLIGLDPRHFDDALQIKLGLMFYQDVA